VNGQYFVIVDGLGDASTNNITITANGAETINGQASLVIDTDYGAYALCFRSSNWTVVGSFGATGAGSVPRSDIAPGSPDYVVINNNLGELSEEQYLSQSRGGMGANVSAFSGVVKATAGVFSAATIVDADISASAAIDATKLGLGNVDNTELSYLNGATSNIQNQINSITGAGITSLTGDVTATGPGAAAATIANGAVTDAKVASGIDAVKIGSGSVDNTEFGYLNGVTSAIQTQIDNCATDTDLSNHIADTTTHGTSGNIVGDTDSQTLTNKTIVTPLIDDAADFEQIATPTNPAAGRSKLYPKTDGFFYTLDSSGTETQIGSGSGTGTGAINIIDNPIAASNTAGYTAATNYTVTRVTSNSPLAGVIDTAFNIVTTTASSETSTSGVYAAAQAMPVALRNSKIQVSFYVTTPSTSGVVWKVSVYNAGGTRMSLSSDSSGSTSLPSGFTGQFVATFDADNTAQYTISFTQTAGAGGNGIIVTNIYIGNGITAQGAAVSSPQQVTMTSTWVSNTTIAAWETRVGSWANYYVKISLTGAPTASGLILNLPAGRTIDTSIILSTASGGNRIPDSTVGIQDVSPSVPYEGVCYLNSSTQIGISPLIASGTYLDNSTAVTDTVPITFANGDYLTISFSVPIAEWAGNGTVNLGPGAQVQAYSNSGAAGTTANTDYTTGSQAGGATFPNVSITGVTATTVTRYAVEFPYPIQDISQIQLQVRDTSLSNEWFPIGVAYQGIVAELDYMSSVPVGMGLAPRNSTSVWVVFSNAGRLYAGTWGQAQSNWSFASNRQWRIVVANPSAPVGFSKAGVATGFGLMAPAKGQYPLTVTSSASGWSTTRAVGIYYQDQDGNHRLKFNVRGTFSSTTLTDINFGLAGVTFKNVAGYNQACSGFLSAGGLGNFQQCYAAPNTDDVFLSYTSSTTATAASISGDVELESAPTWA
jgi:hypothetical protein